MQRNTSPDKRRSMQDSPAEFLACINTQQSHTKRCPPILKTRNPANSNVNKTWDENYMQGSQRSLLYTKL